MGLLRYLREAVSGQRRLCDAIIAAKNLTFAFIATGTPRLVFGEQLNGTSPSSLTRTRTWQCGTYDQSYAKRIDVAK
jgi:hypothetical protein